jgi:hypothetical protein
VSLLTIKIHEATYKQFITATIQDSSGKHSDTTLKPKGIIQKQFSSCRTTILPSSAALD